MLDLKLLHNSFNKSTISDFDVLLFDTGYKSLINNGKMRVHVKRDNQKMLKDLW